jgi:hypothetical protein
MGLGTVGAVVGAVIDGASGDDSSVDGALIGGATGLVIKTVVPLAITFATGWLVLKGLGKLRDSITGDQPAA